MMIAQRSPRQEYLKQVDAALIDSPRLRDQMKASLALSMDEYEDDHPDATLQDFYTRYGDPQQIAQNAVCETEPKSLLAKLRKKRKIIFVLAIATAVLAAVTIFFAVTHGIVFVETRTTYIEMPDGLPEGMTDEEFVKYITEQANQQALEEERNNGKS